tara:strand:+ start:436 stop:1062 length:627 start_codon:yes stop_codon:yes gene_type:complete
MRPLGTAVLATLLVHLPVLVTGYRGPDVRWLWLAVAALVVAVVTYVAGANVSHRRMAALGAAAGSLLFGAWLQSQAAVSRGVLEDELRRSLAVMEMDSDEPWEASGIADLPEYQTNVDPSAEDFASAGRAVCDGLETAGWEVTRCAPEAGEAPGEAPGGRLSPFLRTGEVRAVRGRLVVAADVIDADNVLLAIRQRTGFKVPALVDVL